MEKQRLKDTRIIFIQAADIYYAKVSNKPLEIKNTDNKFDSHFIEITPANLDLYYLREQGKLRIKQLNGEQYTFDFINVTFEYPLFTNKKGEKVIPKRTDKEKYNKTPIAQIREDLYLNGFEINGKEYVRYKRSSGAAKSGSCLFIRKDISSLMNNWSRCGLEESSDNCLTDLTSYEAYKALSLSSTIDILDLNPYNILFVKDVPVTLKNQNVVRVSCDKHENLYAEETTCDVENNIFDGEGLLDTSVFEENGYKDKGMMLLRSRFFKCCAFHTNLQQWFKDNNITDVDQLEGITFAKDIKDIVLVASDSCLKYFKLAKDGFCLETLQRWCNEVNKDVVKFGIVKTDKPTRFFNGEMVETTYQLLNSLQLKSQSDIRVLIHPYIEYISYIRDIKNTPEFIRFYLESEDYNGHIDRDDSEDIFDDEEQEQEYSSYSYKNKVCLELARINKEVIHTDLFKKRALQSIFDALLSKLYNGRALVNGTYATLLGNPYEFLQYIIKKFDKDHPTSLLKDGEICCSFFNDDQEIVGSRAPHTTMGNVLYVKNKRLPLINKYFNLTKEIVVVDAINNNIQQRLSGCDYDSDSMLLTDNDTIVKAAKKNYDKFLVPVIGFKPEKKKMEFFSSNKKENLILNLNDIDNAIANNIVGKIVNLSQLLNSHLWDGYNSNSRYNYNELYSQISILCVLSGAEIDSSKRSFPFTPATQYNRIKNYAVRSGYYKKKPLFFTILQKNKSRQSTINRIKSLEDKTKKCKTSMDYLWEQALQTGFDSCIRTDTIPFFELFKEGHKIHYPGDYKRQYEIVEQSLKNVKDIIDNPAKKKKKEDYEKRKAEFNNAVLGLYPDIKNNINSVSKVKYYINQLEKLDDGYTKLFLLLYVIDTHKEELRFSIKDLMPIDSVPLPTLAKPKGKQAPKYTLFDKYHYVVRKYDGTFKVPK